MNSIVKHSKNQNAEHCIFFVHGFTGNSRTFCNKEGVEFFEFFDENIKKKCDFYSFCYNTRILDFAIARKALSIIPFLRNRISIGVSHKIDKYSDLLKTYYGSLKGRYKSINFICHSMGGILVKDFILKQLDMGDGFGGFYITLATPHRGVEEAKLLSIMGNAQIEGLRPFSPELVALNEKWNLLSSGIKKKFYFGIDDEIVDEISSYPEGESDNFARVDGNHTSIAKPISKDSALMLDINSTISVFIDGDHFDVASLASEALEDQVLFLAYRTQYEPYYLVRDIDEDLITIIKKSNLWINGASGVGKTLSLQRALTKSGILFAYVDLSPCRREMSLDDFCDAIYEQLYLVFKREYPLVDCAGKTSLPFVNRISLLLERLSGINECVIALDEFPMISRQIFEGFVDRMTSLLRFQTNRRARVRCRFVISTIESPFGKMDSALKQKFLAHFSHREILVWSEIDIRNLSCLILKSLNLRVDSASLEELVQGCCKSPRMLKNIIRNLVLFRVDLSYTVKKAIVEAMKDGI